MSFKAVIERVEHSSTEDTQWCRLHTRDQNGRYAKIVGFGPLAVALVKTLQDRVGVDQSLSDVADRRMVVDVEGDWKSEAARTEGGRPNRFLRVRKYELLNGPSAEIFRLRIHSGKVLDEASKHWVKGDLASAYAHLEEFVAHLANKPIPSLDGPQADIDPYVEVEAADDEVKASVTDVAAPEAVVNVDEQVANVELAPIGLDSDVEADVAPVEQDAPPAEADVSEEVAEAVDEEVEAARRMGIETAPVVPLSKSFVPPQMTPDPVRADVVEDRPAPAPAPASRPAAKPVFGFSLSGAGSPRL